MVREGVEEQEGEGEDKKRKEGIGEMKTLGREKKEEEAWRH